MLSTRLEFVSLKSSPRRDHERAIIIFIIMKMHRPTVLFLSFVSLGSFAFAAPGQRPFRNVLEGLARPPLHVRPHFSPSPGGYSVQQIRHAYGFDRVSETGAGQVIAIVDAYGSATLQNDVDIFSSTFGLPSTPLNIYYPQGTPSTPNSGWALETSLDVEWAHAIAPEATIVVVIAKSPSLNNLLAAVDFAVNLGAKQISMSWGIAEFSSELNFDFHFNRPGVSFFASSGDSGAEVEWPAVCPFVVSVGGTSLQLDEQGNVLSENAWSGSGGGSSVFEPRPAYQNGWQTQSGRGVPDVSYNADPNTGVAVYIGNYNGAAGWITVGGTSAGAPQWAGLAALVNAGRAQPLGAWNAGLYSMAATNYNNFYRDIVSGSNGAFTAIGGYDFVTGLGRPVANLFISPSTNRTVTIEGSGFENPVVGENMYSAYAYNPPQINGSQGWQFDGFAGVTGNDSGFTATNASAPEGKQVAFIQMNTGVISQRLNFAATGSYQLSLAAALRTVWSQGPQTVLVYLDDTLIGSFSPNGASYQTVVVPFGTTAGSHLLSFHGTAPNDSTAFIDNIAIVAQ